MRRIGKAAIAPMEPPTSFGRNTTRRRNKRRGGIIRSAAAAMPDVTRILEAINSGNPRAAGELLPLVYDELRKLAAQRMDRERGDRTLQAPALVHEAYLRLVGTGDPGWNSRGHFFAAAAEAMRRILVDGVRERRSLKRGGDRQREPLDESGIAA